MVAIKRTGIREVVNSYTPETADKMLEVLVEPIFDEVFECYDEYRDRLVKWYEDRIWSNVNRKEEHIWKEVCEPAPVLTPPQINSFMHMLAVRPKIKREYDRGLFITRLVHSSYRAGHNDFLLSLSGLSISGMMKHLTGDPSNPIKMTVQGLFDGDFARSAKNCHFTILDGIDGSLGRGAINSKFDVQGHIKYRLGRGAVKSEFVVKGNVGSCGDYSRDCSYDITGYASSCGEGASYSTYRIGGRVDACGVGAQYCEYVIGGDAGTCGKKSEFCKFEIGGSVGDNSAAEAFNSMFDIEGEIGKRFATKARYCRFKVDVSKRIAKRLMRENVLL
jgi:hypothetical protein